MVHWVVTTVTNYFRGGALISIAASPNAAAAAAAAAEEGEARVTSAKEESKADASSWLQSPFSEVSEHKSNCSEEREEGLDHTSPRVSMHPSSHTSSHASLHASSSHMMGGYANNNGTTISSTDPLGHVHSTHHPHQHPHPHTIHSFPTLDADDHGRETSSPGPGMMSLLRLSPRITPISPSISSPISSPSTSHLLLSPPLLSPLLLIANRNPYFTSSHRPPTRSNAPSRPRSRSHSRRNQRTPQPTDLHAQQGSGHLAA